MNDIVTNIFIIIGVSILLLIEIFGICLRYRHAIIRKWKEFHVGKFIINIVLPALIPFIITIVLSVWELNKEYASWIALLKSFPFIFLLIMCILSIINFFFQLRYWIRDFRERRLEWKNRAYHHAYYNLYDVLIAKTHEFSKRALKLEPGSICEENIPYDVFDHIRDVCNGFRDAVAGITNIPTTHIHVSFIYHYVYEKANTKDKAWRWIIGKDSNVNIPLNSFTQRDESMYHFLIHNNRSLAFYNDKHEAADECKYYFSDKDRLYDQDGSVFASKFAFSNNAEICCEGIIMVTTYGKQFVMKNDEHTVEEFKKMLIDEIFPCYKNLLIAELGMLYFRHKRERLARRVIMIKSTEDKKGKIVYKYSIHTISQIKLSKSKARRKTQCFNQT